MYLYDAIDGAVMLNVGTLTRFVAWQLLRKMCQRVC